MGPFRAVLIAVVLLCAGLPLVIGGLSFMRFNNLTNGRPMTENAFFQTGEGVTPVASFGISELNGRLIDVGWRHDRVAVWGFSLYGAAEGEYVYRVAGRGHAQLGYYRSISQERVSEMARQAGIALSPPSFLQRMGLGFVVGGLLMLVLLWKLLGDVRGGQQTSRPPHRRA